MRMNGHVERMNTWWEGAPSERFWLDVTTRNDRDKLLATPQGDGRRSESWTHQLIRHVTRGDLVFHYDVMEQAIVAWSIADGPIEKMDLSWPRPMETPGLEVSSRMRPSWTMRLRQPTRLEPAVSLGAIAKTQWDIFPALRALEDEKGDPLYYPFDTGSSTATRLLRGYLFKLPAVFVEGFPALAGVADRTAQPAAAKCVGRSEVITPTALLSRRTCLDVGAA